MATANSKSMRTLTDQQLAERLHSFGVDFGPIMGATRAVYQRKLKRLMTTSAESTDRDHTANVGAHGLPVSDGLESMRPSSLNNASGPNSRSLEGDNASERTELLDVQSALASKSSRRKSKNRNKVTWSDQSLTSHDDVDMMDDSGDFEDFASRRRVSKKKKKVVTWSDQSETSNDDAEDSGELEDVDAGDVHKADETDALHLSLNSSGLDPECDGGLEIEDCGPSESNPAQSLQYSAFKPSDRSSPNNERVRNVNVVNERIQVSQNMDNWAGKSVTKNMDDFPESSASSEIIGSNTSRNFGSRNFDESDDNNQSFQTRDDIGRSRKPVSKILEDLDERYSLSRVTERPGVKKDKYGRDIEAKELNNESNEPLSSSVYSQSIDSNTWSRKPESRRVDDCVERPQFFPTSSNRSSVQDSRNLNDFEDRYHPSDVPESRDMKNNYESNDTREFFFQSNEPRSFSAAKTYSANVRRDEPVQKDERFSEYGRSSGSQREYNGKGRDDYGGVNTLYNASLTRPPLHPERNLPDLPSERNIGYDYRGQAEQVQGDNFQSLHHRRQDYEDIDSMDEEISMRPTNDDMTTKKMRSINDDVSTRKMRFMDHDVEMRSIDDDVSTKKMRSINHDVKMRSIDDDVSMRYDDVKMRFKRSMYDGDEVATKTKKSTNDEDQTDSSVESWSVFIAACIVVLVLLILVLLSV